MSIYGQAATANGNIATTKVATSINAQSEIRVSFKNTSVNASSAAIDVEDLFISPACWRQDAEFMPQTGAGNTNFNFTSKKWGNNPSRFFKYFQHNSTQVEQVILETDDVANFDGDLIFTSIDPTGREVEVLRALSPYKVESSNSAGFSGRLTIPGADLNFIMGPNLDLRLSKFKAGSKIDVYLTISGQTKTADLSPIVTETI